MTEPSDNVLAMQAARGNKEAYAELLERHYDSIYRQGARVLGDTDAAADLAQEVCISLPAKLASYQGRSRFTTWLYRVVVNAARDVIRRSRTRQRIEYLYSEVDSLQRSADASRQLESAWLRQAFRQLSKELRFTVVLVVEEGLGHAEAGEVLGVSESTVSWRMSEVRKRLRALAAEEEDVR